MPTEFCTVDRVLETDTARPGLTRYDVNVTSLTGTLGTSYETVDVWVAARCQRARDRREPVALTWKESRFGKQIVEVRGLKIGEGAFDRQLAADRRKMPR